MYHPKSPGLLLLGGGVNLNHPVVESLLDVDLDSSTWQLIWIPPPRFAVAIIVGILVVTQRWRVLQFWFLKAYDIRLMFAYQDIKIPSVTSQTSGIPLQNSGSHYDLGCLATWPFLWLWSVVVLILSLVIWMGQRLAPSYSIPTSGAELETDWGGGGGVWGGVPRALNPAHLGWRHAITWATCACKLCLWGHVGLRDRGFVGLSHRGGVVGTSHGCGVLDTIKRGVRVGTTQHGLL